MRRRRGGAALLVRAAVGYPHPGRNRFYTFAGHIARMRPTPWAFRVMGHRNFTEWRIRQLIIGSRGRHREEAESPGHWSPTYWWEAASNQECWNTFRDNNKQ